MNELSRLKKPEGSSHRRKRVGRGQGSGWGKTAGRGNKGQKSRTGNMAFEGFEGGQTPLQRRLPKRGFTNIFRTEYQVVNVEQLGKFDAGTRVDPAALADAGLVRDAKKVVKILGTGALETSLTLVAHRVSASAKEKIEQAGGTVELIPAPTGRRAKGEKKVKKAPVKAEG